jgi:hypothetical protein
LLSLVAAVAVLLVVVVQVVIALALLENHQEAEQALNQHRP